MEVESPKILTLSSAIEFKTSNDEDSSVEDAVVSNSNDETRRPHDQPSTTSTSEDVSSSLVISSSSVSHQLSAPPLPVTSSAPSSRPTIFPSVFATSQSSSIASYSNNPLSTAAPAIVDNVVHPPLSPPHSLAFSANLSLPVAGCLDLPVSTYYYQQQPLQHQSHLQQGNNLNFQPIVQKIVRPLLPVSLIAEKYLLLDQMEGSTLHRCVDVRTEEDFVCKVVKKEHSPSLLSAHYLLDAHECVNRLHEVIFGDKFLYLIFLPSYGDLHSYVRHKRRLKDDECRNLFRQIVKTVSSCHEHGIVLRDLKLRKFVFADPQRTIIKLETLDDAVLLDDSSTDELQDKRGCPAYVSPEILKCQTTYSGKAADIWSLGIILYTMLVGRYPFNDLHHSSLFAKITRGHFIMPDMVSLKARCLIRCLLRKDPSERLPAVDIFNHPWFGEQNYKDDISDGDHLVPAMQACSK